MRLELKNEVLLHLFVFLPVFQGLQLLIKPQIAGVAAFLNVAPPDSLQHGAAFFLSMAASHKTTVIPLRLKFPESLRQAALQLQIQFICLKGGEAWRIHDIRTAGQMKQLHMTGRVTSTAQCVADLSHP